ncbi:glycerophosphodiester phosphodiesterase [Lapillicoccus jejuensis]|uniref:glycerophosphodiester phosphodiesterase n=1 Tax=Lapillicoccus jejuensis TaxID=402171 RepID=A0A542E608_9MICO|nr:glycerophosphodiester phosphodiesterase [Lapillicoccus jejuensis]TQJ10772.1 glycerophosphoryl diester phosphodiesterase [Lapillicoccus jejuensis]
MTHPTRRLLRAALTLAVGAGLTLPLLTSTTVHAAPAGAATVTPAARAPLGSPLVIGHRGASGYRPEHTLASYELAARMGADLIEPDVVSTKDGVLVVRHEPEISGTTDVADHPEFATRRTTKQLDGVATTGWFTEDFTLAELRTLRAKERLPQYRQHNTLYDGLFPIPTLDEVFALRARLEQELHRTIGIIPETKHPTYFRALGLPLEPGLVTLVRKYGLDRPTAPIVVQSFELNNLQLLRSLYRFRAKEVLLTSTTGKGFGDTKTYAQLLSPRGMATLAQTVQSIGPDKNQVIARTADGSLGQDTGLVARAHRFGLTVTPYTFRAENVFLPTDLQVGTVPSDYGRAIDEDVAFLRVGVDGLFCDQPDICLVARQQFLAGK